MPYVHYYIKTCIHLCIIDLIVDGTIILKCNLKKSNVSGKINMAEDSEKWRNFVNMVMNIVPINYLKCLNKQLTCQEGLCPHSVSSLVSCCSLNTHLTYF